jgi:hypothetical protein
MEWVKFALIFLVHITIMRVAGIFTVVGGKARSDGGECGGNNLSLSPNATTQLKM